MELTKREQSILDGEKGEGAAKAMQILAAVGKIYGAENMVPVGSVQVAGVDVAAHPARLHRAAGNPHPRRGHSRGDRHRQARVFGRERGH